MPIHFLFNDRGGYYVVTYTGKITDEEVLDAFAQLFASDEWSPTLNELSDLSQTDMTAITSEGIRRIANLAEQALKNHEVVSMKTAIYAPEPLLFGLSRIYHAMADESPENIRIFRKKQDAEDWLREDRVEI